MGNRQPKQKLGPTRLLSDTCAYSYQVNAKER